MNIFFYLGDLTTNASAHKQKHSFIITEVTDSITQKNHFKVTRLSQKTSDEHTMLSFL